MQSGLEVLTGLGAEGKNESVASGCEGSCGKNCSGAGRGSLEIAAAGEFLREGAKYYLGKAPKWCQGGEQGHDRASPCPAPCFPLLLAFFIFIFF